MQDNIIVSIVVPVFNTGKYLDECLFSLVNQTLAEIEIICVNDASTDNSIEILNTWAKKDHRIIVIDSKVNNGQGWARNLAIRKARGQYIGLVDSDDFVSFDMYQSLINQSSNCTADIVVGNVYAHHSDIDQNIFNFPNDIENVNAIKRSVLVNGCRMSVSIIRKSIFSDYDLWYPEGVMYEDNANTAPIFLVAEKINIYYNSSPIYFYRINNPSTTRSLNNTQCWDRLVTANMLVEHTKRLELYELYKEEMDYSYWVLYLKNSIIYAIFSFTRYQYGKVKEFIREYDKMCGGLTMIKKNRYYIQDRTLQKYICVIICSFPFVGYLIKGAQLIKNRLK